MSRFAVFRRHWKLIVLAMAAIVFCVAVVLSVWFAPPAEAPADEQISSSSIQAQSSEATPELETFVVDNAGKQLTDVYAQSGINLGFLHSTRFDELGQPFPLQNRAEFSEAETRPKWHPVPLSELIDPVTEPQNQGRLRWEEFEIDAPILYAPFADLFVTREDKTIDFSQALDTSSVNSPIQQRLREGVVQLPFSPMPGEVGNSYIIGHSSNFINVESDYNFVFAPLLNSVQPGQEFTIADHRGRDLRFRVFEALAVSESDLAEAYKNFGDRRVVTLQASILENGIPTKRYLVRAGLVLE